MKLSRVWAILSLAVLGSAVVLAQDPVKVDPAHYKLMFENASVRVLHITYPAGASSKMHQHPDAIVVGLTPGNVRFALPDGTSQNSELANESAMYTPAGTHNPTNLGKTTMEAILVEFKAPEPGTATLPSARPGLSMKMLAEGPRAIAYRTTASPTFAEPAGTKHDFDQVVIALESSKMLLSIDGKPAKTTWARGDAQFIGRGVPHEARNTGGKAVDMIIVAIK
jgi:quercetin dioxygenase-like cupin family protein